MSLFDRIKKNEEFYNQAIKLNENLEEFCKTLEIFLAKEKQNGRFIHRDSFKEFFLKSLKNGYVEVFEEFALKKELNPLDMRYANNCKPWEMPMDKGLQEYFDLLQSDQKKQTEVLLSWKYFLFENKKQGGKLAQCDPESLLDCFEKCMQFGYKVSKQTLYPIPFAKNMAILQEHYLFLMHFAKKEIECREIIVDIYTKNELEIIGDKPFPKFKHEIYTGNNFEEFEYTDISLIAITIFYGNDIPLRIFRFSRSELEQRVLCMDRSSGDQLSRIKQKWGNNDHKLKEMLKKTAIKAVCKNLGLISVVDLDIKTNNIVE